MMDLTPEQVLKLISMGESETTEFKESVNDETFKSIGAFSNTRGGTLLIGVTDAGKICGIQLGKTTPEDIANRIQHLSDPRISPSIAVVKVENKNIIAIQVAKSIGAPASIRGRFFKRSGKTDQRMSHEEIMQRMTVSTGLSWDVQV